MYEVDIDGSNVRLLDLYEVDNIKTKKNLPRENFHERLAKEMQEEYDRFFSIVDKTKLKDYLYKLEALMNISFKYLKDKDVDMESIYKEIQKEGLKKVLNSYEFSNKIPKISNNYKEIKAKIDEMDQDKMEGVYYFLFTLIYYKNYLLEVVAMVEDELKSISFKENNLKILNGYFVNVFSRDFSKAFQIFEYELEK
ncbi:MAG: hypothetical protein ACQERZ_08665 [Fusobacteriota bacterium]